jgi:hypothetical protein
VKITMHASEHNYQGPVSIAFEPDEKVQIALGNGRVVEVSHDGTWALRDPGAGEFAQWLAHGAFETDTA